MKAIILTAAVLVSACSLSMAADPKKESTKKSKTPKVSARDLIEKHDKDGDRKLDKTELHNALRTLKYNLVSTKNDSWKKFDKDGDEKIEQKELDELLDANAAAEPKEEAPKPGDAKSKEAPAKPRMTLRPTAS